MHAFPHERLRVFAAALELAVIIDEATTRVPRRYWSLVDQLIRACISVVLNIAEGADEFSPAEKARTSTSTSTQSN